MAMIITSLHSATMNDTASSGAFTARLQNVSFVHGATGAIPKCRFGKRSEDVVADTGAACSSSGGKAQYHAYCNFFDTQLNLGKSCAAVCFSITGFTKSKKVAPVTLPVGDITLTFNVHVVDADSPILLSINDEDAVGIYLNSVEDNLIHAESGLKARTTRVHGHPFNQWKPHITCMLAHAELRQLYCRYGHPSADKLIKISERTGLDNIDSETIQLLEIIECSFDPCQTYSLKSLRFKFRLRDDKDFNNTVYADTFYTN